MIKSFAVHGLFGTQDYNLNFHEDLNILTGKNGSGKTTLLKLLWYLISANFERIVPEIEFKSAVVKTDDFSITVNVSKHEGLDIAQLKVRIDDLRKKEHFPFEVLSNDDPGIEGINSKIIELSPQSVFFPTFRRIEGGFAVRRRRGANRYRARGTELEEAVTEYSNMMSARSHRFVASVSTNDIEALLTRRYADTSEKTNKLHEELSGQIEKMISRTESRQGSTDVNAQSTLEDISRLVKHISKRRSELLRPFEVFSDLISRIFLDKGIQIDVFEFRGAKGLIASSLLSAGEKQMLSFLCYNAFSQNCPIFIDEPEISLHVDWQRLLFPTLLQQATSNQFIISTHSPFIYSKYPEKELILDDDRGGR